MDWFGGHWSGNGFMGMAGDWRTARPGVPGRAMGCANGMARDRRAPGRKTSMARASLWPSLSLPPDPDRTTRHISVDELIWRERRTRLSFPPTPCNLRQNTHLIFLQAMRGPTAMPETKSQSQGSGKRGPQTTRACHTRMTRLASAVRRVGGQPTTRLPSRRVWADSFFFCTFAMWSVCVCVWR